MKFNKIRNLTSNIDLLTKSIKKSEFLVLNEEKTLVRRITEFVEPTQKHVDKKTIYVVNDFFVFYPKINLVNISFNQIKKKRKIYQARYQMNR